MNDFTKDDLKSLRWAIEQVRERTNNRGDAMRGLLTKIQSLIDNYCEHEYHSFTTFPDFTTGKQMCIKCKEFYK